MALFDNYPYTIYELNGEEFVIRDIFRKASFISEYKPYTDLYSSYTIVDGESPSTISEKYYKSSEYYWVILVFNEIHDMNYDWPMELHSLEEYCKTIYGDQLHEVRHWEKNGIVVGEIKDFQENYTAPPSPGGLATAVSFYEYEERLNDAKRSIRILRPELLTEFVKQFKEAIRG